MVIIPNEEDMEVIHNIIFHELCIDEIKEQSRKKFKSIIDTLKEDGADGIILGCTEIGRLIHAVELALNDEPFH